MAHLRPNLAMINVITKVACTPNMTTYLWNGREWRVAILLVAPLPPCWTLTVSARIKLGWKTPYPQSILPAMCTATCVYQNGINLPFLGSTPSLSCSAPADGSLHHTKNHTGYISPIFAGKDEQCVLVEQEVEKKAWIFYVIIDDINMILI